MKCSVTAAFGDMFTEATLAKLNSVQCAWERGE